MRSIITFSGHIQIVVRVVLSSRIYLSVLEEVPRCSGEESWMLSIFASNIWLRDHLTSNFASNG